MMERVHWRDGMDEVVTIDGLPCGGSIVDVADDNELHAGLPGTPALPYVCIAVTPPCRHLSSLLQGDSQFRLLHHRRAVAGCQW